MLLRISPIIFMFLFLGRGIFRGNTVISVLAWCGKCWSVTIHGFKHAILNKKGCLHSIINFYVIDSSTTIDLIVAFTVVDLEVTAKASYNICFLIFYYFFYYFLLLLQLYLLLVLIIIIARYVIPGITYDIHTTGDA